MSPKTCILLAAMHSRPGRLNWHQSNVHRFYRLAEAQSFLEHFASDRSHMMGEDGKWEATPPSYSCIISSGKWKVQLYLIWLFSSFTLCKNCHAAMAVCFSVLTSLWLLQVTLRMVHFFHHDCLDWPGGERMSLPYYLDMQQPRMESADVNGGNLSADDSKYGFVLAEPQFLNQVLSWQAGNAAKARQASQKQSLY